MGRHIRGRPQVNRTLPLRLWRGEHELQDTFWRYVILIGLLVNMATSVGFMILFTNEHPLAAFLVGYGLSVPYNVFALVALWRSANAYAGPRTTAEVLRIAALAWITLLTVT